MLKLNLKYSLLILFIILLASSCEEFTAGTVNYIREMRRFINDSLDGSELYSTDIYPQTVAFSIDSTEDLYLYQVNNVSRNITVDSLDLYEPPKDIYPFNYTRDAVAVIDDEFTGNILRIRGNDTTTAYKFESNLQRFAYFIKQYSDDEIYHGWRFWAYSCLNYSIDGKFTTHDSKLTFYATPTAAASLPNYRLGPYYIVDDFIAKLPLGDSITFNSDYKERLFIRDKDETLIAKNTDSLASGYQTGWQIPTATSVFYNLIVFDSDKSGYHFKIDTLSQEGEPLVVESTLVKRGDYVIPFKVDI